MFSAFDEWIRAVGPMAYVALGLASAIEYLFPPFPGDVLVVAGGVYAVRGQKPWALVLLAVTLGSLVGSAIDFGFGRWLSRRIHHWPEDKHLFGITRARLLALEERMNRYGAWLLVANRFLPGIRSLIFVAAGTSQMKWSKALLLGMVSSLAWNVALLSLGISVGGNAEKIGRVFRQYQTVAAIGIALVAVALLLKWALKLKKGVRPL
jgi:membrane protein DedA with SNARE-associated domain